MFDRNHIMVDIIAVYFTSFILCNVGGYIPQKCLYLLHAFVHPKQQRKKQRLTYTHTPDLRKQKRQLSSDVCKQFATAFEANIYRMQ